MNTLFAVSLFDSPLVILVIVLVGALSQWLMKRRLKDQEASRGDGGESPPTHEAQEQSPGQLDLQEALRALLGGEPSPRAPQPPPIPRVMRDAQPAEGWTDEEQTQREQTWMNEPPGIPEAVRPPPIQTAPPLRPHPALARASATAIKTSQQTEEAVRRFEQLNEQGRHPATVVNSERRERSRSVTQAVALVRDSRTVRQAFVASLVFGPPKAFET